MRIGILTQPLHNNYGGLLQNFALQEALRKMGHTPLTLDVKYQPYKLTFVTRCIKFVARFLKKIRGDKNIIFVDVVKQMNFFNFPQKDQKDFIDKYIEIESFTKPLEKTFWDSHDLDALIVGSDQVWRCRFSPYIFNYFLNFAEDKEDITKISYAASFGVEYWDGDHELIEPIKSLLRHFSAVSVREESGVAICKSTFNKDATLVLDPTLLLEVSDYKRIILQTSDAPASSPQQQSLTRTCAVYILDATSEQLRRINDVCNAKGLSVNYIGRPDRKGFPSVMSWLSGIFSSDYVITDSFHGTVFSILAHKKFTTIVNAARGTARFETLLNMLDLKERLVSVDGELINEMPIDYDKVEEKLNEQRKSSYEFISSNLYKAE